MSALHSSTLQEGPIPVLPPESQQKRLMRAQPLPPPTEPAVFSGLGGGDTAGLNAEGLAAAYLLEDRPTIAKSDVLGIVEMAAFGVMRFLDPQFALETRPVVAEFAAMDALEAAYIFEDRPAVTAFIRVNRLRGLLIQATKPLADAFGEMARKTLRLVTDDEGSETLFCLVMVSGEMADAQHALECFDREWWLARCALRAGLLNFDFELV